MEKIKIVHDPKGKTLTIWLSDSSKEHICEETTDEIILMKDIEGKVIGIEILNYASSGLNPGLIIETILKAA